ncbi:MAG: rod shape-determining protein MreC, partial [Clostridia bacterium]|nr:rod shape-determining protein MreC [Clostridia bacterium]
KIRVGALINRTRESGVIGGDTALMSDGCCGLSYLSGSSAVTIGDFVVTSGEGGVFPAGLMIGTVSDVRKDASNVSIYGVVKTASDVSDVTQVMVITHFEGQGGIAK